MKREATPNGAEVDALKPADNDVFPLPVISDKPSTTAGSQKLWRSLAEKNGDAALLEAQQDEFPKGAGVLSAFDRRGFLQLLGGTAAVAGAAACWRPPDENIYPYTRAPENVPGVPQHYASTFTWRGYGVGVVAESYDGRPIKIEGNALHPASRGATTVFEQAELYRLYDPNRGKTIVRGDKPQAYRQFLSDVNKLAEKHAQDGGAKLRFLVQPTTSPTEAQLRERIRQRFPNARFYAYQPVSSDLARKGAMAAFGQPLDSTYDLTRANVILSLDSDFLSWEPERIRLAREYSFRRVPENTLNRLYAVEPSFSLVGMQADHRLRVKPSQVLDVARALAAALAGAGAAGLGQFGGGAQLEEKAQKFVQALAADLLANRGRCVVIPGLRQPAAVHALAHAINDALGNIGTTVQVKPAQTLDIDDGADSLRALLQEIQADQVDTLVIDAYNPAYTAPADLDLAAAIKAVTNSIYHGFYVDETALVANWYVPAAHPLESWGDARAPDGTVSLVQPLIAPLFNGVSTLNLFAAFTDLAGQSSYEIVRSLWAQRASVPGQFDEAWRKWLADGVLPENIAPVQDAGAAPGVDVGGVSRALQASPSRAAAGDLEINIVPDYRLYDGRYGNVAWLQELPDPVTKVTWDNTVLLSPATAERLKVETGSLVKITVRDRTVEGPVYVLPGHADDTATVSIGHGRKTEAEQLANQFGFNANLLRFTDAPWFQGGAKVEPTGRDYKLAITQDHWSMEGRDMALMGSVHEMAELQALINRNSKDLEFDKQDEAGRYTSKFVMQQPVDYSKGYKWGMSIDLGRCIACNACVIACQAENNIPIVGKEQVIRGREMHWLMVDRYFVGDDTGDPQVVAQPRMCVHCETAPCEYVCPVNATVHSDEGLNDMVYNRCVGTRYCSNNCPYKVRRFNYLHWNYGKSKTEKMMMNPEVTVRARGVMEKCTYCVQRIERARIQTRIEGKTIQDGDIVTACQQACPTNTIVFGNLNDPTAKVTALHKDNRRYDLLYSLGTRPRTGYLARVKNYNPALVVAKPASTEHH